MKKKIRTETRKLTLNRETLRLLEDDQLSRVAGGATAVPTNSYCRCPTGACAKM